MGVETLFSGTNPKILIDLCFLPREGSPYKISVTHARRKSAGIGLHFPARRGPASAAFRVYFSSAAEKKSMIIHKYFFHIEH